MKLLFDVGNSRLKWAWENQGLKTGGVLPHGGQARSAVFDAIHLKLTPSEIWASSVATPDLRANLEDWAMRRCNLPIHWAVSQRSACGVTSAYDDPEKLGVDRWLAVIGAFHRAHGAACVVDAGTALTIDVVDSGGRHLGGLIAPGVGAQRLALQSQTQVRAKETQGALGWLGRDTDQAVAMGTLHGAIGLITRVVGGICREQAQIAKILTGGEAGLLQPHLGPDWIHAPDLVLEGLARVARQSRSPR